MDAGVDSRDLWQRRAGPLYSLLVAGKQLTRLPLAADLSPSEEDVARARAWLPIAGLVLGAALAVTAALLLETALVPVVVAALVVAIGLFATGAWLELGVARAIDSLMRSPADAGASASVTLSVAVVVLVVMKVASLIGTSPAAWTGALVASQVAGRWSLLAAGALPRATQLWKGRREESGAPEGSPSWTAIAVGSGVALLAVVLAGGAAGAVAFALALLIAWIGGRIARPSIDSPQLDALAAVGALSELVALLCFAAWSPAR